MQKSELKPSDVLLQCGWIQDRTGAPDIGFCLLGAVCYADASLYAAMRGTLGTRFLTSVIEWNDAPGRTQEEVVALLQSFGL